MLDVDQSSLGKSTRYFIATMLIFRDLVRLLSIEMRIEKGISTKTSIEETSIMFEDADIKDIAFLDNCNLLALCRFKGS